MSGFRSITPNININTQSGQLRTELLNTFSRLDGQLTAAPYRLAAQTGPVSNTGSGESTLMAFTLNFGTLTQLASSVLIYACGTTAANANNKTFSMKLGSTTVFTSGASALNNKDWTFKAEIVFSGGNSQITWGEFTSNGNTSIIDTNTSSENFGTNLVVAFTGTGTATGDVSISYYKAMLLK